MSLKSRDFERIHMTTVVQYTDVTQVVRHWGTNTGYSAVLGFSIRWRGFFETTQRVPDSQGL